MPRAENSGKAAPKKVPGRPFKKGQSGNPGGRPKGLGEFKELCREHGPDAVKALVAALDDPDNCVPAAKALIEFGWGKATQAVEVSGPEGGAIQSETTVTHAASAEDFTAALAHAARAGVLSAAGVLPAANQVREAGPDSGPEGVSSP